MDADRERRMEALRARVQAKKEAGMLQPTEDELVITSAEVEELAQQAEATNAEDDWMAMIDRDADRWRNLAATLVLIGSILGLISGALILQGNPSELLNTSLFAEQGTVDISGTALEDVDGHGVENVSVELLDRTSKAVLQSTMTDDFGYFSMENITQETHIIVFSKEGYTTVERTFLPDDVGLDPVTMKPGLSLIHI